MAEWKRQWESVSWTESVQDWISRVLEAYQLQPAGEIERVSLGLTATVFGVPSEAGPLYFKASAPTRRHEAELVSRIAPHSHGLVPAPLAVELDEGWMLSPGLGIPVSALRVPADPQAWRRIFDEAGALQSSLSLAADDLAEGGLPGFLPGGAAEYLESALVTHASLPPEHPLHISGADAEHLAQGLATVERAAALLAALPVPNTLQQGALNPEQVLAPASPRAAHQFIGWGEARWAHPFGLIGDAVQRLCEIHGVEPLDDPVRPMIAAYLHHFESVAPAAELASLLGPAALVAKAQRHEALMDLLEFAEPEDQAAHAPTALRLLADALGAPSRVSRRAARAAGHAGGRAAARGHGTGHGESQAVRSNGAGRRRAR